MTDVDRRLRSDLDSEPNVEPSSVLDFAVVLTSDDSHLRRELELFRERYARPDGDEMPLSAERRQTAEIGILRNGIDH